MRFTRILVVVIILLLLCISCSAPSNDIQNNVENIEQPIIQQKTEEATVLNESETQENKIQNKDNKQENQIIEPEEKLVTLSLYKYLYNTDISETYIGAAKKATYKSLEINEDTINIVFTQEQHKVCCQMLAEVIDKLVNDIAESTEYIRLVDIKNNANYTTFYVYLSADTVNAEEQSIATALNVYGVVYNIVSNSKHDLITTNFIKYETNKVIESYNVSKSDALKSTEYETPQSETIVFEAEFTDGNYTCGIDFPAGRYTITAIDGSGNVSSSNMWDGGLNEMMGAEEDELYSKEFKNAKFENNVVLEISGGVTVKIHSDKADAKPLKKRVQPNTETVTLSNGYFISGEDFPAGVYNIVAVEGTGNVSSDNMFDGGINAMMGIDDSAFSDLYSKEYKNIDLPEGIELEVSGGLTIDLVPSK